MPLFRTTLRQYEAFVAVADELGFAAASRRLNLTPSAVSQLVAELEATIGFRLFDRSTRRVALSTAGRDFLGPALSVLRHAQNAETAASDVRNRAVGIVRIGAPLVMASSILPSAVRDFKKRRPLVAVHIRDVGVDALIDRVANGDLDLAIGPDRPESSLTIRRAVFVSPWVLWCAPSHRLAKKSSLRWKDLTDVSLVAAGRDHEVSVAQMRNSSSNSAAIVPVDVVDNVTTALGVASQGLAATLAPAYVDLMARHFGLVMRRVKGPEATREISLYRPAHRSRSPAAEEFEAFLFKWMKQWSGSGTPGMVRKNSGSGR